MPGCPLPPKPLNSLSSSEWPYDAAMGIAEAFG